MFLSSFQYFDLAESDGCRGDWLLLTSTWNLESRLCGSVLPPPFISTRGRVWLYFHSLINSSGQAQGFRLSYIRGELGDEASSEYSERPIFVLITKQFGILSWVLNF